MKFPQIFMLLAFVGVFVFSCKETAANKQNADKPGNNTPSIEKHPNKPDAKKVPVKPVEPFTDSIQKKKGKSKVLDTLKPKLATL